MFLITLLLIAVIVIQIKILKRIGTGPPATAPPTDVSQWKVKSGKKEYVIEADTEGDAIKFLHSKGVTKIDSLTRV